jgi:hypothetical protein
VGSLILVCVCAPLNLAVLCRHQQIIVTTTKKLNLKSLLALSNYPVLPTNDTYRYLFLLTSDLADLACRFVDPQGAGMKKARI